MQFIPAVNINDPGIARALRLGQLKLQRGQWVWTDDGRRGKPSRFVGVRPGYVSVVHPDGPFATGKVSPEKFLARCEFARRLEDLAVAA